MLQLFSARISCLLYPLAGHAFLGAQSALIFRYIAGLMLCFAAGHYQILAGLYIRGAWVLAYQNKAYRPDY